MKLSPPFGYSMNMEKTRKGGKGGLSLRFRFPEEEARYRWLPMLLDAYEVIDQGITIALNREKRRRNRTTACREGCDVCCRYQTDIPVYPLELVGIYWFVSGKTTEPDQEILRKQLSAHGPGSPCPFLVGSACSIYPVRPAACRQFIVFTKPCAEGEDPFYTRRGDVLIPIQEFADEAFFVTLPFYGITSDEDRRAAIRTKFMHKQAHNLQTYDWKQLLRRMDDYGGRSVTGSDGQAP